MDGNDERLRALDEAARRRDAALDSAGDWYSSVEARLGGRDDEQARADLAAARETKARVERQARADYAAAVDAAAYVPEPQRSGLILPPDDPVKAKAARDALEARRRRRDRIIGSSVAGVAAAVVLGVFVAVSVSNASHASDASSASTAGPASTYKSTATVEYEVFGDQKGAMITLTTPTGMSQQDVSLPLTSKSAGTAGLHIDFPYGSYVSISAQGTTGYGKVTCRISVDGVAVSENVASGYGIASCHGRT